MKTYGVADLTIHIEQEILEDVPPIDPALYFDSVLEKYLGEHNIPMDENLSIDAHIESREEDE